jgi:thiamine-phosphate pyrophosphorylase
MSQTRLPEPCLCAVTARARVSPDARTTRDEVRALLTFVDALIKAGVDLVQIREVDLDERRLSEVVTSAVAAAAGTPTQVLVNSCLEVARRAGAAGVHLKEADRRAVASLRADGPLLIGRSLHGDVADRDEGLDYIIFGTVYPTLSKPDPPTSGLADLAAAAAASRCPVVAIGGITPERARLCLQAGAGGVAAVGAFLPEGRSPEALGPSRAVQAFRAAFTL